MLSEIYAENFALIEKLNIEFHAGLNIITGETGAGKSLLTDAVALLLGGKVDREMIRHGESRCLVEGTFVGPFSSGVLDFCAENGIDDDTLVISREISADKKNIIRLNGRRISLSVLTGLGEKLMNIHSQVEHFSLFRGETQGILLDCYGGVPVEEGKNRTRQAYNKWQEAKKQLSDFENCIAQGEERLEYLRFRAKELSKYQIQPGEKAQVKEELQLLRTAENRYREGKTIYAILNGEGEAGVVERLYDVLNCIRSLASQDESLKEMSNSLNDAYYQVEDSRNEILSYCDEIDSSPAKLEALESRMSEIIKAEKKFGCDADALEDLANEINQEIAELEDSDYSKEKLSEAERESYNNYLAEADTLSDIRKKVGKSLSEEIIKQLHDMLLPQARFGVDIQRGADSCNGYDKIVFLASMNKGEELLPLARVASGGEISRVLLATKIILSHIDDVQTMIFDEIDSGLGGETIDKVGAKMRLLAKEIQVIAVTHSPLVAAKADYHFEIHKKESNGRMSVEVNLLDEDKRLRELARMLSGDVESAVSLAQAGELIKNGQIEE